MDKKCYLSAYTTRFDILKKYWEKHSPKLKEGVVGTNASIGNIDLGGVLCEIDWTQKEIAKMRSIRCPGGIERWQEVLVVPSMWNHEFYFLEHELNVVKTLSHPYLNDVHSISVTSKDTLLVTSTGIDAILEFGSDGTVLWSWFATKNGYATDQLGNERALILENTDHRKNVYPTLTHTTHVNSVIEAPFSDTHVLATLFHQGEVVRIDKQTGKTEVLLDNLQSPHGLKRINEGFIVSNTRQGKVLLLDDEFALVKEFDFQSSWLQDASLSPWRTLCGIRSEKCDVVELAFDTGEVISQFQYDHNWRGYQIFFPPANE